MEGKGSGGTDVAVPGLDGLTWDRWIAYRIEIRKPLKPASIPAAQQKLAAYGRDQAAVVEQSIANGWQGLFELKRGSGTVPRETATQRIERALARREGRTFDA